MSYLSNYSNRATIFETGDTIEGDHVSSLYEELGSAPGAVFSGIGVPYKSGGFWAAGKTFTSASTIGSGILGLFPMVLTRSIGFDRIGVYVTSAGSAGTAIRMGIYTSNTSGMPYQLVSGSEVTQAGDSGSTTSSTGSTISVSLTPGRYYVAAVTQVPSGTEPSVNRATSGHWSVNAGGSTNYSELTSAISGCFGITGVSGSLSSDLSSASLIQRASGHSIALRMV